jgi:hypothetical protein
VSPMKVVDEEAEIVDAKVEEKVIEETVVE